MSPRAGSPTTSEAVLDWLRATASEETRQRLDRYGIPKHNALGVPTGVMKKKAQSIGRDHALATALWATGIYEARTMAVFIADPASLDADQADAWVADFDNWAICDTACFHLLDRLPFAWAKVDRWAPDERAFVRRAAFALIWALSVHDKSAADAAFGRALDHMRVTATDARPLVRKAVDMALRATGKRNAALNAQARALATDLAASQDPTARWIGRHAGRELASDKVRARLGLTD